MPAGLLRDGGPDDGHPRRHWLVLPLSITAHACAAAAMIIIPLAAAVRPPTPHRPVAAYMRATSVQPLEVPAPRGGSAGHARPAPAPAPAFVAESSELTVSEGAGAATAEALPGLPTGIVGGIAAAGSIATGDRPVVPSPPPVEPRRPVPVGGVISAPRKIVHVAPVYPQIAREARVEGTVILEAVINERGDIERLKVLRSVALLDAAAIQAVSGWRYSPTMLNNVPVPVLMTITVTFSLRD
jgi:protein TonB